MDSHTGASLKHFSGVSAMNCINKERDKSFSTLSDGSAVTFHVGSTRNERSGLICLALTRITKLTGKRVTDLSFAEKSSTQVQYEVIQNRICPELIEF